MYNLTFCIMIPSFKIPEEKPFENFVGKGGNAINKHFSFHYSCFLPYYRHVSSKLSSANSLILDRSGFLSCGKDLTLYSIDTHFGASTADSF